MEVIKGASSAVYGGQALGGVINLVSKCPDAVGVGELIANVTTRDAQDLSAYVSTPLGRGWSGSILSGYNRQSVQDLDDDDWIDMPGYPRVSVRPRLFYAGDEGSRVYLMLGAISEDRRGGTGSGGVLPNLASFQQNQDTDRYDIGLVTDRPIAEWGVVQLRASNIDKAIRLQTLATDRVRLINQRGVTRARGVEALFRWRQAP